MDRRIRAIIIENDNVLLIHRIKRGGGYWVFPGGGIEESDKTPESALRRECLEELGVSVNVGTILVQNNDEVFYMCSIIGGELGSGDGPEFQNGTAYEGMYALEWLPLKALANYNVLPEAVKNILWRA